MTFDIEAVKQLIKLMKDNQLTSLKVGDIELTTSHITVPAIIKEKSPVKAALTPEEILAMDNKEMAELITWSSGDEEVVRKALTSRKP